MKLRYLLLPLPLLLAGYLLHSPQGQSLLRQADIASPLHASTRHSFYKWQDASGQWHFSDQAPDGQQAQKIVVDTALITVLPAPQSLQQPAEPAPSSDLLGKLGGLGEFTSPAEARQLAEARMQHTQQLIEQH